MLNPEYFIHPNDAKALEAMKAVPGFTPLSKKFSEIFGERAFKVSNLSSKLRLSEKQLPDVYALLPPICEKLEINVPELYLEQNPYINACTFGDTTPAIVINSGLLNNCSTDVIKAVLAHECGHIVCHHTLYKTMVNFFLGIGASIINMPFLSFGLKYALLYWDRCSEYSADRASAYVMGGSETVVKTMTELTSGTPSFLEHIDREEFLNQAELFHSFSDSSAWNKFLMYYELLQTNHPFTTDRAADIVKWCSSQYYENLCNGVPYVPPKNAPPIIAGSVLCPNCAAPIDKDSAFCSSCGAKIVHCPNCHSVFTENDAFCDKCGSKLQ